ncbi:MAG: hypothetical protein ACRC4L_01695 [Mycoplasma sp.]
MKIKLNTLIDKMKYTTSYFTKTRNILSSENNEKIVTMQFKTFSNSEFMVCGIEESLEVIKTHLSNEQFNSLTLKYFPDGTIVKPNKCVLSITGQYTLFCELENIIDSILARRSSVATNCWKVLEKLSPNDVMFMADRSDDYLLHPYDGYSAYIAGIRLFSNESHIEFFKDDETVKVVGTMPHALIHQFDGDINKTFQAYYKYYPQNVTMLVDFENDVIKTLNDLKPNFKYIDAVRLDTSSSLLDKSLKTTGDINDYGVSHNLVVLTRNYLNSNNGSHIKIIASSGIDLEKISKFLDLKTPIDKYGIGSSLIKVNLHFTADLVKTNEKLFSKYGRQFIDEDDMTTYE